MQDYVDQDYNLIDDVKQYINDEFQNFSNIKIEEVHDVKEISKEEENLL